MLMRDAIKLLVEAAKELDEHDREYQHVTRNGLKEEIQKFVECVQPKKKDRS